WRLKPRIRPPVYGLEMYRVLNRAKVTLNMHAAVAGQEAANMRMFEVVGTGSCLLTDFKPNLSQFFEVDREVVAYRTIGECRDKVRWLLDHPAEREAIARAGQARVLRDYGHAQKARRLDGMLRRELAGTCVESAD
ncbi:MAG: glycosyltransferase, partial [Candidatus Eremiobacterota bacterium]